MRVERRRYHPTMPLHTDASPLPLDAQGILELAARSMFQLFSTMSQGMFLVDLSGRIVWVNEGYRRFLPDLGVHSVHDFVGRMVEEVIPNTQMRQGLAARGDHTLPAQRLHHVLRLALRPLRRL